jgi:hypothetical protein
VGQAGRAINVVPANRASWEDLQAVFGTRGDPARCWCQRFKMDPGEGWASVGSDELSHRLRVQTNCGHSRARTTTGLVAYLDGEPVRWCAVEPRSCYPRMLLTNRVPWEGRSEDKTDDTIWAVTCFVTRTGYRRRGWMNGGRRGASCGRRRRESIASKHSSGGFVPTSAVSSCATWGGVASRNGAP